MKFFRLFSFYYKIQFLLVLFIVIPIISVAIISYVFIKNEITDKVQQSNQQSLNVIAQNINRITEDIAFTGNLIANDINIQHAILEIKDVTGINNYHAYINQQKVEEYYNIIESKLSDAKSEIFFVNTQDFILISSGFLQNEELRTDWLTLKPLIDFNDIKMQWLGLIKNNSSLSSDHYYSARVIIHQTTKEHLGVAIMSTPKSYFVNQFNIAEMGLIQFEDRNGDILFEHSSPLYDHASRIYTNTARLERLKANLYYHISSNEVTGKITRVIYSFVLFVVISMCLFIIASILLAKSLNRPIAKLKSVADKFGSGVLSVRFPDHGKDEMALLGKVFNDMLDQIQQLIHNIEMEQEEKRKLELRALFAQINPHFLLNTLNSLKCNLALSGDQLHSRQMDNLMSILRGYMRVEEMSTLNSECQLIESYIELMQIRMEIPIQLLIEMSDDMKATNFPRLLIQPIVENAIIHGFAETKRKGALWIYGEKVGDTLQIHVKDNGKGFSESALSHIHAALSLKHPSDEGSAYNRIGLMNVQKRLKLTFGQDSLLLIKNNSITGACVSLIIKQP